MNLRYLKKSDGTMVLQKEIISDIIGEPDTWENVPTIEEPKPKKELWEELQGRFKDVSPMYQDEHFWKAISRESRDYIENERKEK